MPEVSSIQGKVGKCVEAFNVQSLKFKINNLVLRF